MPACLVKVESGSIKCIRRSVTVKKASKCGLRLLYTSSPPPYSDTLNRSAERCRCCRPALSTENRRFLKQRLFNMVQLRPQVVDFTLPEIVAAPVRVHRLKAIVVHLMAAPGQEVNDPHRT
jgi:hypothetical protein